MTGSIPDFVASRARAAPEAPVLYTPKTTLTAAELERRVAERAGALAEAGVEPTNRIAVAATDRLQTCIDVLAIIRAGGVAAVIDPDLDPDTRVARLRAGELDGYLGPDGALPSAVTHLAPPATAEAIAPSPMAPNRRVTLLFTSGTLGEPTPVVHTAWNHTAAAFAAVDRFGLRDGDAWYDPLGLYHMGGLAPLFRCLVAGMPLALAATPAPSDWVNELASLEGTIASVVPTMVHRAVEAGIESPPTLRCLLVGGGPLDEEQFHQARSRDYPVWSSYGMTETTGQICTASPTERKAHPDTVGRPLFGLSVEIRDNDDSVDPGEIGTIHVRGPTVAPSDPADACNPGFIETGDRGYVDEDDRLWVRGRVDDAIRTGGELVYPEAVREVLEADPAVAHAAVVGLEDPEWGEAVVAAVVPADESIDIDRLYAHCRETLPAHAVPKRIAACESLPRTASGTVDRDALRRQLRT